MSDEIEVKILDKLVCMIRDIREGLDPDVLEGWYRVVEEESKTMCPEGLRDTIEIIRDPILTMKFEVKASKRAIPCIIEAIENHLPEMPFATRLYFQKLEDMILENAAHYKPAAQ